MNGEQWKTLLLFGGLLLLVGMISPDLARIAAMVVVAVAAIFIGKKFVTV